MAFDLKTQAKEGSKSIQLIDYNNGTIVTIDCKGALMNSWKVQFESKAVELIVGNPTNLNHNRSGNKLSVDKDLSFEMNGFRSGKMSPFSCRIENGMYQWDNQTYRFDKFYLGEHAMHGLIYDANFELLSSAIHEDRAVVELGFDYQGTDPGFPFPYQIIIQWSLYANSLIGVKTTIRNVSNHAIPMMDGWHPYFTLGGLVDAYTLSFIADGKLEMNDSMIPTGKIIEADNFNVGKPISTTHFDDCYLLQPSQNRIQLSHEGKTITVTPIHHYPYLQLYTPEDRQSIAIENLSGAPNCFNNKMGLQLVEPQEQIYFETSYQFNATSK